MNIRALKTWHWVVIGLVGGAMVGLIQLMWAAQEPVGGRGYITQQQFEEAVHAQPVNGQPYVTGIVIQPCPASNEIDLVRLKAFDADANSYRDYLFAAPGRFFPTAGGAGHDASTVADYLRVLAAANPALKPRYAWWDGSWGTISLYALLGGFLIGGAWPALLRVLSGPAAVEPAYDLNRFRAEPAAQMQAAVADGARVQELDDELATSLASAAAPPPGSSATPIRKLGSERVEALPEEEQAAKDFAGEYYPVEKHPAEKHLPHGFSLVELIVVIGIVTLLIAFALPALRYARMSAETVKCASNLRGIGQALHAYANENHGSLPAWSGWHLWPQETDTDASSPAWTVEMTPYIGKPDSPVYNCPSFPRPGKWRNYFLESQWSGRSGRNSMKLTDITMVGRFVLSGDTSNMGHFRELKDDDSDPDDYGGGMLAWPSTGGIFMHLGGNNVLFDDGHVSLYAAFNPMEITFNPHRMESHDDVTPD